MIGCNRRGCKEPARVSSYTTRGYVDEHLCVDHAWEIVQARVAALELFKFIGSKQQFVAVHAARVEGS